MGASPNGTVHYYCPLCHLPTRPVKDRTWGHTATLLAVLQRSLSLRLAPAHPAKPL